MKTRKVVLALQFEPSKAFPEDGTYYGGIALPKFINELEVWVTAVQDYDLAQNKMIETGAYKIHLTGSQRSLYEFGKSLINLSKYDRDDPDYHEHIEGFTSDPNGPPLSICLHKAKASHAKKPLGRAAGRA